MSDNSEMLKKQIEEATGNVQYTYVAHWKIVNRLELQLKAIKIVQIVLTALSTGGFLTSIFFDITQLVWVGGLTSAFALAVNLYMLNFNLPENIKQHTNAANELWEVREKYKSLLVDFDSIDIAESRAKRDDLIQTVSYINKKYPGTDTKGFRDAQDDMGDYQFGAGEADRLVNLEIKKASDTSHIDSPKK